MSISLRPFPERAKEFLKKHPQSKVYWGVVAETYAIKYSSGHNASSLRRS